MDLEFLVVDGVGVVSESVGGALTLNPIGDEFLSCTPMVNKIFMFLGLKPLKSCYTVWEHDPNVKSSQVISDGADCDGEVDTLRFKGLAGPIIY